jgi:hypothetical protein
LSYITTDTKPNSGNNNVVPKVEKIARQHDMASTAMPEQAYLDQGM